jgi:hypothetical protein
MDELLLDSSYLFPIFGVRLEYRDFESIFSKLSIRYSLIYNPVSLIEAKWYVLRQTRKRKASDGQDLLHSYRRGLLSLERDQRLESTQLTNEKVEELSDSLLAKFSIQDYFDRLIYSTAIDRRSIFLTEDGALHQVFNKTDSVLPKPKKIMKWKDLLAAEHKEGRKSLASS